MWGWLQRSQRDEQRECQRGEEGRQGWMVIGRREGYRGRVELERKMRRRMTKRKRKEFLIWVVEQARGVLRRWESSKKEFVCVAGGIIKTTF
jgi:hypothetical protein